MNRLQIGGRDIGGDAPPFNIAEVGINHNGELELAHAMIAAAKRAGADAVKFQTFTAAEFVNDASLKFTYTSQGREITESQLSLFQRHEFSPAQWRNIKERCDAEGIIFLSTPQNPRDLDLLLSIGIGAIKIGSDDFNNLPLLRTYAQTGLPILLSCGMADIAEVHYSLQTLGTFDGYPTVLLLCTSQYPTPPEDVNLRKLTTLGSAFPGLLLGFSDHTQGPLASSLAVAMGACVFEKHFTMDNDLPGPDHWFSENPTGLSEWIHAIRTARSMMGSPWVRPTAAEIPMRTLARRSIVALSDIPAGVEFTAENLGLRRPGDGLPGQFLDMMLGRHASKSIQRGKQIELGDFY